MAKNQSPKKTPGSQNLPRANESLQPHVRESHEQVVESSVTEEHTLLLALKSSSWSGPLPHPEVAEKYEAICPGALDRLLKMVEKQSEHRQQMEAQSVQAQVNDIPADRLERKRGQIFGLVIALAFILTGGLATVVAQNLAGQIIGALFSGTGVVGVVSLFVIGREKKESDAKKREEADQQN